MVQKLFFADTVVAVTYTSGCFVQMSRGQLRVLFCFIPLRTKGRCLVRVTGKKDFI